MKKILFISSSYTGHGHKSITTAISEQLNKYDDVHIDVLEGYALIGGKVGVKTSALYGPLTRNATELWKIAFDVSSINPLILNDFTEFLITERFLTQINKIKPDMIVSVHAQFNGSILNILSKRKLNIPVCTVIADLVNIHPAWWDKRITKVFCPTDESVALARKFHVPEAAIMRGSFPVRSRFTEIAAKTSHKEYDINKPLNCLIMSGGEGSGNLKSIAMILLKRFHTNVTIICGRNLRMQKILAFEFEEYGNRVKILGFCNDIEKYMMEADLCLLRGSPNSLMEAIMCNVPTVITGALPGQEADNPYYIEQNNLGVNCSDLDKLPHVLEKLLKDDAYLLKSISEHQRKYRNINCAKDIADEIYRLTQPLDIDFNYKRSIRYKLSKNIRKLKYKIKHK